MTNVPFVRDPGPPGAPLRVLHVVASNQRRGAEVFAGDLVLALAALGVEQFVGILRGSPAGEIDFAAPSRLLTEGERRIRGGLDMAPIGSLRALSRSWRPDVIQAHGGEPLKYAVLATRGRGAPIVYRRIGSTPEWMAGAVRMAAHGFLLRRADLVVAVAEAVREDALEQFRASPDKVVVIPNGVDLERSQPSRPGPEVRRALRIPSNHRVVASVGAFTEEKDPLGLLDVAASVIQADDRVRFLLVGDGPLRAQVEDAVRARGLQDAVQLLGVRDDVPDILAVSDVLLLTSRTEGMPAVVIEAGLVGLPVVAYAVAGVPEAVADGVTGLLAPPGDASSLTRLLLEILKDGPRRTRLSVTSREWCRSRYDIRSIAPRYLESYKRLIPVIPPRGTGR